MIRVIQGDCLEEMRKLPDQSVYCCVTSPPYWGLRDYGVAGQIGLESTPQEYIEKMVAVFREVRRALRDDGTLWLNLGDSYASSPPGNTMKGVSARSTLHGVSSDTYRTTLANSVQTKRNTIVGDLKPKDLVGIPWRVALALQQPYYTGRIKNVEDRIWLAAMLDAEGCMFIHKRKEGQSNGQGYKRQNDSYSPGVEIANTSLPIIERIMALVGKGSICSQSPQQNDRRKQTIYRWNLRTTECRHFVRELYPHIIGKQHQARILCGCPSSGERAEASHAALIGLHRGSPTDVDFDAPATMFEPGFYLRQDIIWKKLNPMPESVRDRCTKSHEYLFLLAKSEKYYFDNDAIKEDCVQDESRPTFRGGAYCNNSTFDNSEGGKSTDVGNVRRSWNGSEFHTGKTGEHQLGRSSKDRTGGKHSTTDAQAPGHRMVENVARARAEGAEHDSPFGVTRNKRSVWTVATQPYSEAHFATFPPALIEPCILAGCPVGGAVLDPFGGAGTSGLVADRLGRDAILIELNPAYADMARARVRNDSPLFAEVT